MTLHFEKVSYRYPGTDAWAIHDLDLTIQPDESVLVAGASGSGKSTLCRASIGLVPHFHQGQLMGQVLLEGLDTRQHPVYQLFRHAGLVFQNRMLNYLIIPLKQSSPTAWKVWDFPPLTSRSDLPGWKNS